LLFYLPLFARHEVGYIFLEFLRNHKKRDFAKRLMDKINISCAFKIQLVGKSDQLDFHAIRRPMAIL